MKPLLWRVVILGSQCALRHSASLRSAHWSSITTSPRSAQLVSQNLWAKTWTQNLSAKNWAKTWGSKLDHKKLSQSLRFKTWAQKLELKTWSHKLEPQKLERKKLEAFLSKDRASYEQQISFLEVKTKIYGSSNNSHVISMKKWWKKNNFGAIWSFLGKMTSAPPRAKLVQTFCWWGHVQNISKVLKITFVLLGTHFEVIHPL